MRARSLRPFVLCCVLLALGAPLTLAGPSLELHWDRETGHSVVFVVGSGGIVIEQYAWNEALPTVFISEDEEIEIPILVAAVLRDRLADNPDPEAPAALELIDGLLGAHAATPTADLPPTLGLRIGFASYEIVDYCGSAVDADGSCVAGGPSGNTFCSHSPCKTTVIRMP